jgi:hypothetical protein
VVERLGEAQTRSCLKLEEEDGNREELGKLLAPRKKMASGRCSLSALYFGVLRRSSGEVEGLYWQGRWWSSSMAWG